MARDNSIRPKLGRIGAGGDRVRSAYLRQVGKAVARAGTKRSGRADFHGSRIGRGAGVGRVLAARDRYAAFRQRRVVIKTRLIKLAGRGLAGARVHLRYLQRDGVTLGGSPGELYAAGQDRTDGRGFLERCDGDRHQFRFIVSPEDAVEYADLKDLTRRLMHQMEEDLGTTLDWVAVDHYNTGHPHTHIVLRGKDDRRKDLIIAREYLSHGMRERAAELVQLDLGPRSDVDIAGALQAEVSQERFTSLDRGLLRAADEHGIVASGAVKGPPINQTLRAGRLQQLRRFGLAAEVAPGRWQLAEDLEPVLRRRGERGDIIKTIHRALRRDDLARAPADYRIYDPAQPDPARLVGRVIERGFSDEHKDRHYLIVDGVDGRCHYVDIGKADATEPTDAGAIVAITARPTGPRKVDRNVLEVANAHGGRYSGDLLRRHDRSVDLLHVQIHERRLEAMRRAGIDLQRHPDGSWTITPDHLDKAAQYEYRLAASSPVIVQVQSTIPLERQVDAMGATWLDRELTAETPMTTRDIGFGRAVSDALDARARWLVEQQLADLEGTSIVFRAGLMTELRRRDLAAAGGRLARQLDLPYEPAERGARVEGVYRGRVDLASGRFAVIEKSHEFTLVPWRDEIERFRDRAVSGLPFGDSFSWSLGRDRGLSL